VDDFDLLTYSSPCFTGDALVLTINGYKKISDVTIDDVVITHLNDYKNVIKPMVRKYKGDMFCINSMCSLDINCTPEHPFYVREMFRKGHHSTRCFKEPVFKFAKDLSKKDYLGIAIDTRSELPKWNGIEDNRWGHHKNKNKLSSLFENKSFWYLMGRYIGDGWKKKGNCGNGIIICSCDKKIDSLLNSIKDCGFSYNIQSERTVNKVQISSNELFKFVERYGYYAYGKRIDGETIGLPKNILKYFIKGYIESDGCCINGLYKITSTSKELVYGIGQCVSKVYNVPFKIYFTKRKPTCKIEGRIVNQRDTWQICWKIEKCKQDKAFFENGYIWFPIRNINKYYSECIVYNMEVEDNHTYTANGVIVHNCQDFSAAGLQKGGIKGSGTRSSLLWECERAIESKRPKYLLMENVAALVSQKFIKLFNKWQHTLEGYGYINYAKVLNAKEYGVPQNRERIFMVSVRDDLNQKFYFPQPFKLEKRLKDILEDKVDEKYYLSENQINSFQKENEKQGKQGNGFAWKPKTKEDIAYACTSHGFGKTDNTIIEPTILRKQRTEEQKKRRSELHDKGIGFNEGCYLAPSDDGLSNTLTSVQKDNLLVEPKVEQIGNIVDGTNIGFKNPQRGRIYGTEGLSPAIYTFQGGNLEPKIVQWQRGYNKGGEPLNRYEGDFRIRKLTPKECFRLMDVPEKYIDKLMNSGISNSQLYKLAGNSIVVSCLYHIFRKLFIETENDSKQLELF
jgi:DNA (cytosine-5)-methyltransferase 1